MYKIIVIIVIIIVIVVVIVVIIKLHNETIQTKATYIYIIYIRKVVQ